jgi:K+-dependent Na+/Ca+ exchanger-like protein
MEILFYLFFFFLGLAWLAAGSEALIAGSVAAARRFHVRPIVIGLTIVAYGTSAPEAVVSMLAAGQGNAGISLGNVIGSNIANIGLILGVGALILPVEVRRQQFRFEFPMLLAATLLLWLVLIGGHLSRWEGIILLAGAVIFTWLSYRVSKGHAEEPAPPPPPQLGRILLDLQAITEEELREAMAYQDVHDGELGRTVVQLGMTDQDTVAKALRLQDDASAEVSDVLPGVDPGHHRPYRLKPVLLWLTGFVALGGLLRLGWLIGSADVLADAQTTVFVSIATASLLGVGMLLIIEYLAWRSEKRVGEPDARRGIAIGSAVLVAFGLIGLGGGAQLMVDSAVFIAKTFEISDAVIGLTLVALGTSLPELAACISASLRGVQEVSLGNVVGSNIFNVCVVIGLTAAVFPFATTDAVVPMDAESAAQAVRNLWLDLTVMTLFTLILVPLFRSGMRLSRREGAALLVGYVAFMAYLFMREMIGS